VGIGGVRLLRPRWRVRWSRGEWAPPRSMWRGASAC